MAAHAIIDRWDALVGKDSPFSDRLIVIANEDASGNPRHINLQKLYWFAKNSSGDLDRDIGAIAIDHLGALERDIDISKKPKNPPIIIGS